MGIEMPEEICRCDENFLPNHHPSSFHIPQFSILAFKIMMMRIQQLQFHSILFPQFSSSPAPSTSIKYYSLKCSQVEILNC
jgi:hypothetical protein